MAPPPPERKGTEKSYLASAVESINPWGGSRSTTPTPKEDGRPAAPAPVVDHSTNHLYGRSLRNYPPDCPPLNVLWFHAVDVPKRKPQLQVLKGRRKPAAQDAKPPVPPKKYVAFSTSDSRSIETAYQKMLEQVEDKRSTERHSQNSSAARSRSVSKAESVDGAHDMAGTNQEGGGVRVHVNEDFLFDVDIEARELAPVYWLGPIYEVRRGTWFYQESAGLRPCEENLAAQLEEGYLKMRPWTQPAGRPRSDSDLKEKQATPKASSENLKATSAAQDAAAAANTKAAPAAPQPQSYRLFGTYMNSIATYQDGSTAYISSEGMLSWVTTTMYERFSGGGYMSGVKLVRGWTDLAKPKAVEEKRPATPTEASGGLQLDEKQQRMLKRRSAPPSSRPSRDEKREGQKEEPKPPQSKLERQLSSLIESSENRDPEQREEEIRRREEQEIQDDYNAQDGETQGRDIEHLVLVTHGIGQLLGLRMESVNFVHDVNVLRKTLKGVYTQSADLRALNSELGAGPGNCRIQVLPVCWRHLLDFPKQRERRDAEHDLAEAASDDDDYPSLEDITIEGVAFARSLISDLAVDVLLYQSAYREQICRIVLKESNRIFALFKERNPQFKGKVHLVGHSLGSAIYFDILCRQKERPKRQDTLRNPLRFWPASPEEPEPKDPRELIFDFDVEDFYCLGSPVGLFQMLKGRTIAARHLPNAQPSESPLEVDYMDDPFLSARVPNTNERVSPITGLPFSISSPKVSQLFNVFHPSDPISYRLEPLISPAMASLKPQFLPYTKKGIFGTVAPQGLAKVGQSVTQGVSGLWSSLSAGIASNILNRSLGLTNEEVASMNASGVSADEAAEKTNQRKRQLAEASNNGQQVGQGEKDSALIDDDLETLYSRFQKRRLDISKGEGDEDGRDWVEEERKSQKMRREELKVRALNRNGRVDYSIQESVLDFNPINTIASHMSYWADEDVIHFIMSQVLSNKAKGGEV